VPRFAAAGSQLATSLAGTIIYICRAKTAGLTFILLSNSVCFISFFSPAPFREGEQSAIEAHPERAFLDSEYYSGQYKWSYERGRGLIEGRLWKSV
jgi:hypothetical protein